MSDEADDVTVTDGDFGRGRVKASIIHGQYVTSMNMTRGEALRLRDALTEYLEPGDPVMSTDVEKIIEASEPAAWERLAPQFPVTYRVNGYTRRAHRAGFEAGIRFVRAALGSGGSDHA